MNTNPPFIAEEGDIVLYVSPDHRTNKIIASHYADATDEYIEKGVTCYDKKKRDMWRVDVELIRMLVGVRPKLQFDVYRKSDCGKPWKVDPDYVLMRNAVAKSASAEKTANFPPPEQESPFV